MDDSRASHNEATFPMGREADPSITDVAAIPAADLQAIREVEDRADLMALLERVLRALAFSDFAFTLKQSARNPAYYFSTSEPTNEFFCALADWEFDISAAYATPDNRPVFQSTIDAYLDRAPFATSVMAKSHALRAIVRELGFEEIYHIPLRLRDAGSALLSISTQHLGRGDFRALIDRRRTALDKLCERVTEVVPRLFVTEYLRPPAQVALGHTPLLLLNTLAKENLSLGAAAESLCISVSAANKHVAAIKKTLAAKTIASAVYKAAKLGLID